VETAGGQTQLLTAACSPSLLKLVNLRNRVESPQTTPAVGERPSGLDGLTGANRRFAQGLQSIPSSDPQSRGRNGILFLRHSSNTV
jgi:hypothetical protein